MSVRTEPRVVDVAQELRQTLMIPAETMMAIGSNIDTAAAPTGTAAGEHSLHEADAFTNTHSEHPLERTVCVNIRASLSDLCLKAQTSVWQPPSTEATNSIFQQAHNSNLAM